MEIKNIFFIGFLYSEEKLGEIYNKEVNLMHDAANKFQWNLVNGLLEGKMGDKKIKAISSPSISCYPQYPKICFKKELESLGQITIKYLPFLNLRILKSVTIAISTLYYIFKWQLTDRDEKKVVITYAMFNPYMIVNYIFRKFFKTKQVLVILDFPEFMNLSTNNSDILSNITSKLNVFLGWKLVNSFDGYILLTEHIARKLNLNKDQYIVIEGFADSSAKVNKVCEMGNALEINKRVIMYSGSLNEKYGVKSLVDSFEHIENEHYELWLCGLGDIQDYIREKSKFDSRIKYFGYLENSQVKELQAKAHILINPRPSGQEFTKYSFPSKILEYMSSGKIVLTTRLEGIPNDYNPYLYFLDDEASSGIANKIKEIGILSNEELISIGKRTKSFVENNKNYTKQGKKVLVFLENLLNH